jgi:hypothetical protein
MMYPLIGSMSLLHNYYKNHETQIQLNVKSMTDFSVLFDGKGIDIKCYNSVVEIRDAKIDRPDDKSISKLPKYLDKEGFISTCSKMIPSCLLVGDRIFVPTKEIQLLCKLLYTLVDLHLTLRNMEKRTSWL